MKLKICQTNVTVSFFFAAAIAFSLVLKDEKFLFPAFAAAFLHEGGHVLALYAMGKQTKTLNISVSGIELKRESAVDLSLMQEVLLSLAGAAVNFIFFGIFLLSYKLSNNEFLLYNSGINLVLGIFNLLPVQALDGGRALYYLICSFKEQKNAERAVEILSVITAAVMLVFGVILFINERNASLLITSAYLIFTLAVPAFNKPR